MVTLYATFKARGSPRRRADQVLAGVAAHLPLGPPRRRRRRHQRRPPLRADQGGTKSLCRPLSDMLIIACENLQGDHSARGEPPVAFKTEVPLWPG